MIIAIQRVDYEEHYLETMKSFDTLKEAKEWSMAQIDDPFCDGHDFVKFDNGNFEYLEDEYTCKDKSK
jgi:hypothetical protein